MKTSITLITAILLLSGLDTSAQTQPVGSADSPQATFYGGVMAGYCGGTGGCATLMVSDFASQFPLNARIGVGYARVQPGDAPAARRIFINNATNGTPTKKAWQWDFRFDLMRQVNLLGMKRSYLFGGPRHTRFTANFNYVGGNEDFDVKSNQWGIGGGLESHFAISRLFDLVRSSGVDYFATATLSGHDTSYNPDGTIVNQREDYTWSDADDAIHQPKLELHFMMGLNYRF